MSEKSKKRLFGSPLHIILAGVFCLALLGGVLAAQVVRADGRILPNVSIGGVNVGGLTPQEARARLDDAMRAVNVGGLQFHYQDRNLTVKANDKSAAPPSQAPVTYDLQGMVDAAFAFGHGNGPSDLLKANVQALFTEVRQPVLLNIDSKALHDLLVLRFGGLEQAAMDASLKIIPSTVTLASEDASATPQTQTTWRIDISPDSSGLTFDYDAAIGRATAGLSRWQGASTDLQATVKPPEVAMADIENMKGRVLKVLQRGDVSLAFDDQLWTLPSAALPDALTIQARDGGTSVTLKPEVLEPLLDQAAKDVEIDPKPTHFKLDEQGRAVDFDGGALGKRIDRAASLARVNDQFESSVNGVFPLAVTTVSSPDSDPIAEELGVRELLGYGTSNFAGSPVNRRKNIANGARLLNGLIIKPGETLGLLDHLRPFDAKNGYFPELVIKENRTVPEYGGGLCQIGTTTFRATMGAGLPVVNRQNHSYRVVYYEPAGTDATIYDPAPDYKFLNDTQDHVVLITKQVGKDTLRFELWGTRDGRVQAQSKVKIWNITPPPAPKLIETSALAEGAKKCFETAHAGATTNFTYTITYPDGHVKSQDFHSVYKPWQAQCLIGKAGAPNIIKASDGAIKELPPAEPADAPAPPPAPPIPTPSS